MLGTHGVSWAPALINQLGSSGPGSKHIAHGPQGLSTCSCIQAGGSPPSPDPAPRPQPRTEKERGKDEVPRTGHLSVPQAREQQLLPRLYLVVLFSRCQGTKKRKREERQRKERATPA